MIAENAAAKSDSQNSKSRQPVSRNTLKKFTRAEKRLFSILVHLCCGLRYHLTRAFEQGDFARKIG